MDDYVMTHILWQFICRFASYLLPLYDLDFDSKLHSVLLRLLKFSMRGSHLRVCDLYMKNAATDVFFRARLLSQCLLYSEFFGLSRRAFWRTSAAVST